MHVQFRIIGKNVQLYQIKKKGKEEEEANRKRTGAKEISGGRINRSSWIGLTRFPQGGPSHLLFKPQNQQWRKEERKETRATLALKLRCSGAPRERNEKWWLMTWCLGVVGMRTTPFFFFLLLTVVVGGVR